MSHSVPIKTEFKSRSALRSAFEKLGWTFKQDSKIKTYPGDPAGRKTYELVAVNPQTGGYDVGIIDKDGEITLECDFYSPGKVAATLGQSFTELKKQYVNAVTRENFEQVEIEQMFADGSYILIADDGL
jgi:hypothetical protein